MSSYLSTPRTAPSLPGIAHARDALRETARMTPVMQWPENEWPGVWVKREDTQHAGSFKWRGVSLSMQALSDDERARGIMAASGGNHALAVAMAAQRSGVKATLHVPRTIDPARLAKIQTTDAHIILHDNIAHAFNAMQANAGTDSAVPVHPFDHPCMAMGSATLGAELMEQLPELDAVVIPVGGGGLIGGMAAAIKQISPRTAVYGVEPEGAPSMRLSFDAGRAIALPQAPVTIADSLASPAALDFSFTLARQYVDDIVLVSDDDLRAAMHVIYARFHIQVEPACAATTAAIMGPLRAALQGRETALLFCGSNIGAERWNLHAG